MSLWEAVQYQVGWLKANGHWPDPEVAAPSLTRLQEVQRLHRENEANAAQVTEPEAVPPTGENPTSE